MAKKMKRQEYERQMRILHGELVAMQEWVKDSGAKIPLGSAKSCLHPARYRLRASLGTYASHG